MNKKYVGNILNEETQIEEMTEYNKDVKYFLTSEKPVFKIEGINSISDVRNMPTIEDNDEKLKNKKNDFYKNGKWTEEEDLLLKRLVIQLGPKNWKKVSISIPNRTAVQCLHRWTKILQPGLIKGP